MNTPGQVGCISEDSQPHEYFLHLFGEEVLDTLKAKINFLERKILLKGHLGSCSCSVGNLSIIKKIIIFCFNNWHGTDN